MSEMATQELVRVEISRSLWGRGRSGGSLKRKDDGLQCCLGFIAKQAGFADEEIRDQGLLSEVCSNRPYAERGDLADHLALAPLLYFDNETLVVSSTACREDELAAVNDDVEIDEARREEKLTELAKRFGYEFIFVD